MSDSMSLLAKALGMMGSQHDGEVLNAARMAEGIRKKMDKSWSVLLTGGADDAGLFNRAMRAENRVVELSGHVMKLTQQVHELQAVVTSYKREVEQMRAERAKVGAASASGGGSQRRPRRSTTDLGLSAEQEDFLVQRLLSFARSARWVHQATGWERPMHLRSRLALLAKKRGLRFEQPSRGYYRFVHPD